MLAKYIHVSCVVITISFFLVRGLWVIFNSNLKDQKWPKKLAPTIDTVLLVSAVVYAIKIQQYPFVDSWLTAKIIGLLFYIGFGVVALTYGKTKGIKIMAFTGALLSFMYIVLVAMTKNPWVIF